MAKIRTRSKQFLATRFNPKWQPTSTTFNNSNNFKLFKPLKLDYNKAFGLIPL
jgi:hypothetical protein